MCFPLLARIRSYFSSFINLSEARLHASSYLRTQTSACKLGTKQTKKERDILDLSPRSASGNLPPELRCFYSKNITSDLFCKLSSDSLPENSERNPPVLQASHQLVVCAAFCGEDGR